MNSHLALTRTRRTAEHGARTFLSAVAQQTRIADRNVRAPFLVFALCFSLLSCSPVLAQGGGDQIIDGIGETALVARYILDGNTQDRSRNSHHATMRGSGGTFVDDTQFGKVLSLPGEGGSYLQIPGNALEGEDTISVTGWVFLRSAAAWQRFFDFGQNATTNFFCTPVGEEAPAGYRARITTSGWESEQGPVTARVITNKWVHLAVILDATRKTLSAYLDGVRVGQSNVTLNLEQVLDQDSAAANLLYLGKSRYDTDPTLNAKLHDVRLYSIALTEAQVATIHRNALSGEQTTASNRDASVRSPSSSNAGVGTAASPIVSVPDISVETTLGTLPRLPAHIPAVFRNIPAHVPATSVSVPVYVSRASEKGASTQLRLIRVDGVPDTQPTATAREAGPTVRVIWPSPTNNQPATQAGTYTITGIVPGTPFQPKATVTVKAGAAAPTPSRSLEPFPLGQVILEQDEQHRDTQFMKNRDKFVRGLAASNPDRFLYNFRDAFGQKQPDGAQALGGWDNQTTRLRGHASGHYLSAIAQAYASSTYDPELRANFLQKMNYMIDTLCELSQKSGKPARQGGEFNADPTKVPAGPGRTNFDSNLTLEGIRTDYQNWGTGFISGYPPDQFIMLEQGATYGGSNRQIWAPYYTLHKILAGLLDCYEVGGNKKALEIAQGMGLWVYQRLKLVPTATRISMWNRYIAGEYGGMNEVMARLFRLTNDKRFIEGAQLFDNISFFFGNAERTHGLAKNVDTLRGKHANQHLPQITGALETYRNTRDPQYYHIADNFWEICTDGYMYSIGGVAGARNPNNAECFTAQPNTLFTNGFARGGQNETCATYNLLKLSRQLFMYDHDAKYMDYYEQALYNDILASVAENNPGNTYHIPLNPGARKQFGNGNLSGFTCCNGTALESSTKLQDSIYFRSADNSQLYVNLYAPSTLTWTERNVVLKQQTDFPYADTTRLTLNGKGAFEIKVRVPKWATRGFSVSINGRPQKLSAVPGTYVTLRRTWKDQDTIEIKMPFGFSLDAVMDQPSIASLFYGPVLLAAEETEALTDWRSITLDSHNLGKSVSGNPAALRFNVGEVPFKPFFESYGRYSVYLNVTRK